MNVSFENVDKVNALITLKIEKADYEGKVAEAIKDFRKKASIPGFRPGQVPVSLLKKRFGTEILAEQVNKVMVDELYKYIREQKINILGEPMPNVENFCGGVQVTIERTKFMQMTNVGGDVTKDVTKDIAKQLSDRQRIILRLIKDDTFVTTNEMSQKTGVTTRTIKRDLEYLQEHGVLIREGGRKEGRWLILIE